MKKRYLGFATISLVAAFGLAACGSDDKPNSPKDETHFNTLDEAPECTSYNEGDTITVGKNNIQYLCEDNEWVKVCEGEFSNIVNNPIWQSVSITPINANLLRIDAESLNSGARAVYEDIEILTE